MWQTNWREQACAALDACKWDIVIIGGGITGAGILLEAARNGLRALLVEQRDFAWGTSSRSSKLVHGGLRYLKEGKLLLTRDSVRERQKLLQEAAGLVEPQSFAFADYRGRKPGRRMFELGLALYDLMAGQRMRHYFAPDEFAMLAPHIATEGLDGGMCYLDAKTDDARLVLRVLQEALACGGSAINYMAARQLIRRNGQVCGVELQDAASGEMHAVQAKVVISATGAWADAMRGAVHKGHKLRPLRGSHLVLPAWRLPVAQAVSLMHPQDGRPVFAFPWEGVTLVGTTDVDHRADLRCEAAITPGEVSYLLAALDFQFPQLGITREDIIATYAGVRPVIDSGKADPSKEGRDHAVWLEDGLLTVTGGKLTTFRLIAQDALKHAEPMLRGWQLDRRPRPIFRPAPALAWRPQLNTFQRRRLAGRYGCYAGMLVADAREGELEAIAGTDTLYAELRWAARMEAVQHLEDLLLRRTRLGLQLRHGGAELLPKIRAICQPALKWDDARWNAELAAYLALWQKHYSVPEEGAPASQQAA
ncbi:glycerol-3-phosphate dehydrogenase/oxidase [Noviherbaspirillum sp. UKPF54]|uniref:glycerol-3-phosphate dehydrogenase/oxidase n=1 Tax=Noviherbaspirillum sp. UKPF54 TaxID=2601898 RepID=UPI0011B1BC30|nr:glycerol-3-phosphate dehydrogenase/oxidase [Noviherbaspirillum sp. UKPF54]QDZ29861.1 glycerol-3-phosphate dehydrogenase/oxidase [Noviherbaspirillum sp. UKPF54]